VRGDRVSAQLQFLLGCKYRIRAIVSGSPRFRSRIILGDVLSLIPCEKMLDQRGLVQAALYLVLRGALGG
jgi:hypothetical protein